MPGKKLKRAGVLAAATIALPIALAGTASGHGYPLNPPSRQYQCAQGAVECGPIKWEPQSVEGPGGFPQAGPADGELCSGGVGRFAGLDDPNKNWPVTHLQSGQQFEFTWNLTAAHATKSFRYFVTKDGWNPNQPLTRPQLELDPFLTVPYHGEQPPWTVRHAGQLPAGKSGRHMIYAVWEIADTANAFYACIDVYFE